MTSRSKMVKKCDLYLVWGCLWLFVTAILYLGVCVYEGYMLKEKTIETQKQTIEHLNIIISRHDTTHSKCFKIK